jgi:hypothetical protein
MVRPLAKQGDRKLDKIVAGEIRTTNKDPVMKRTIR